MIPFKIWYPLKVSWLKFTLFFDKAGRGGEGNGVEFRKIQV